MTEFGLEKHFKLTARKKLYFGLAAMFHECMESFTQVSMGGAQLSESMKERGEEIPEPILRAIAEKKIENLRALYCVCIGLRDYKQAMGEYPEFTKFISLKDGKTLDGLIAAIDDTMRESSRLIGNGPRKTPIIEYAFGPDFIHACETTKLKGEA